MMLNILESLGRLFSRDQIRALGRQIHAAGVFVSPEAFAGYLVATMITAILFLTAVLYFLPSSNLYFSKVVAGALAGIQPSVFLINLLVPFVIFAFSALVLSLAVYFTASAVLILRSEARKNAIEAVLPEFLTLVGANVRAGMTLDQAMWYAARPEFGLLSVEVRTVIKGVFSGEPFNSALDRLSERFDSRILQRTLSLMKQASATGGEVAKIFEMTSSDARETAMLKKDIAATLLMYEIFVLFAACIGAPFLFAVMSRLITSVQTSFAYAPSAIPQSVGMLAMQMPTTPTITPADFFYFSIAVIALNTLISAFIVGIIRTGSRKEGLKYFPVMLIVAYLLYWIVALSLESFLGELIMNRVV